MINSKQTLSDLTLEDLYEDPKRFGMPTFEEFRKDPEKYKGRHDELLALADASTTVKDLRDKLETQTYKCLGYDCGKSLEKVERIAKEEGYRIDQMDMVPRIYQESNGKIKIVTEFVLKPGVIKTVDA